MYGLDGDNAGRFRILCKHSLLNSGLPSESPANILYEEWIYDDE
jgi:hypothetical protein